MRIHWDHEKRKVLDFINQEYLHYVPFKWVLTSPFSLGGGKGLTIRL